MTFLGVLAAQVIRYVSLNIEIGISLRVTYTTPHEDVSKHLNEIVILYTVLFEKIVGVLSTCHTQYT